MMNFTYLQAGTKMSTHIIAQTVQRKLSSFIYNSVCYRNLYVSCCAIQISGNCAHFAKNLYGGDVLCTTPVLQM